MATSGMRRLQLARRQRQRREAGLANQNVGGAKTKTPEQVGFLLSDASPLEEMQKDKLKKELRSGQVKIR